MKPLLIIVVLLTGCSTYSEQEYRQPWVVYKTRADIVTVIKN